MATFVVSTGLGSVQLWHSGRSVTATGSDGALACWRDAQLDGLYGAFGHVLQVDDCLASDLNIALITRFGADNVQRDDDAWARIDAEMAGIPPELRV